MRGDGGWGRGGATGIAGFADTGAGGCGTAAGGTCTGIGAEACATAGTEGLTGRAGTGIVGVDAAEAGGWAGGGVGTENVGLTTVCGTTTRGGGAAAGGGGEAFTVEVSGAGVGEAAATGRTGAAGAVAGACCLRIAFRTSPGLEILDRSILVLISSPSARLGRDGLEAVCASLAARK
jgi:hypothetical protein